MPAHSNGAATSSGKFVGIFNTNLTPPQRPCLSIVKIIVTWKKILRSSGKEECYSILCQERHLQSHAALSTMNFSKA
jgi:hypothetical protein